MTSTPRACGPCKINNSPFELPSEACRNLTTRNSASKIPQAQHKQCPKQGVTACTPEAGRSRRGIVSPFQMASEAIRNLTSRISPSIVSPKALQMHNCPQTTPTRNTRRPWRIPGISTATVAKHKDASSDNSVQQQQQSSRPNTVQTTPTSRTGTIRRATSSIFKTVSDTNGNLPSSRDSDEILKKQQQQLKTNYNNKVKPSLMVTTGITSKTLSPSMSCKSTSGLRPVGSAPAIRISPEELISPKRDMNLSTRKRQPPTPATPSCGHRARWQSTPSSSSLRIPSIRGSSSSSSNNNSSSTNNNNISNNNNNNNNDSRVGRRPVRSRSLLRLGTTSRGGSGDLGRQEVSGNKDNHDEGDEEQYSEWYALLNRIRASDTALRQEVPQKIPDNSIKKPSSPPPMTCQRSVTELTRRLDAASQNSYSTSASSLCANSTTNVSTTTQLGATRALGRSKSLRRERSRTRVQDDRPRVDAANEETEYKEWYALLERIKAMKISGQATTQ